ncbi:MAG: hypothetical protein IH591_13340 [Bacteroidales bacterium]|nr:hypothetical protein [Bacteroidales bacterium]
MKRQVFIIIFSVLTLNSSAQDWYNKYYNKSLSEMNSEELSFLYEKSQKTVSTGKILTIAGTGLVVGAGIWGFTRAVGDIFTLKYSGDSFYAFATIAFCTGLAATTVGVPTFIIGSNRRNTVRKTMNNIQQSAFIQIIPSVRSTNILNGYCTGLTITMTF